MVHWGLIIVTVFLNWLSPLHGDQIPITRTSDLSTFKREKRFQKQRSNIILPSAPKSTVSQTNSDSKAPFMNNIVNPYSKEKYVSDIINTQQKIFSIHNPSQQQPVKPHSDPFSSGFQDLSKVQPSVTPLQQTSKDKIISKIQRIRGKYGFESKPPVNPISDNPPLKDVAPVNTPKSVEYPKQQTNIARESVSGNLVAESSPLISKEITTKTNAPPNTVSQGPNLEKMIEKQKSRKRRRGQSRITPPVEAKPNASICYEWAPNNQSFQSHEILKFYPIFNRENGLQPGEYGGKHVKENATIYSPSQKEYRKEWSFPASEGQDHLVLEVLQYKRRGIFVDVGARYWHRGSNSFALEYYFGWEGVCIEADSHFYPGLVLNRTCQVVCNNAISNVDGEKVHFHYQINGFTKNPGNDDGEKYTVSLGRVFQEFQLPSRIDYLSIDIEGYEYEGIQTIDFSNYIISVISVERPSLAFHQHLVRYGYWWLTHLPGNFGENMYIHSSIPLFKEMMDKYRPKAKASWRKESASYLMNPSWKLSV